MSNKNILIKGKSNEVQIVSSLDFADYTEIKLTIGVETYSTLLDTDKLFVFDGILVLDIGLTTSLNIGVYTPRITGDNYLITCDRYKRMQPIQIINC